MLLLRPVIDMVGMFDGILYFIQLSVMDHVKAEQIFDSKAFKFNKKSVYNYYKEKLSPQVQLPVYILCITITNIVSKSIAVPS